MPLDENPAGHVAIATNEYYVSLWPARCLEKDGKKIRVISDAADFVLEGRKGCLVFNQDLDKENEGDDKNKYCDPDYEHEIDEAKVSNEDLNAVIEEFLRYNGIDPEDVTLAKGEEKYREYKQLEASLPPEEAKLIKDDQKPVKSLAETKYSIMAELVSRKRDDDSAPFYKSQQSCVSFAFNLVQMAWLKLRPDPIPIVNYEEAKNATEIPIIYFGTTASVSSLLTVKKLEKLPYKVPWFEKEVVRRYLITGSKVNNQPIISVQPRMEKVWRQHAKPFFFSTFVLLLIGYLIPETAYPNLFIYCYNVGIDEVMDDPSIVSDFILPLLIMVFAHNWCGVFLSVVILQGIVFLFQVMNGGSQIRFWVEYLSVVRKIGEEFDEHLKVVLGREPKSYVEFLRLYIDFLRRALTK